MFLNQHEFEESVGQLNGLQLAVDDVAEIGRSMVLPGFRGKNLLLEINRYVVAEAKNLGKKYLIATIHPDNMPSRKSSEKLGMKKITTYTKSCGYIRDIYGLLL